jgi:predicted transcriptional regulator
MIDHMKQLLIQLDDALAARLEKVAPAKSHKRSEFVRRAILRSLDEELEHRTRAAYERWPDEEPTLDPSEWAAESEAVRPPVKKRAARRTKRTKAAR